MATYLHFKQLSNKTAKIQYGCSTLGAYSTCWKKPTHPGAQAKFFCVYVV